jgi:hypothetical protein
MNQHWRQISVSEVDDDDNEVGLTGMDGDEIVCYKCHKKGHKANKCPEKEKGKDERTC